jgi:hemerythrin-like domain-containing protein
MPPRFCGLLTSHIRREENELFQEIQRTLSHEELDRAGAEIGRRELQVSSANRATDGTAEPARRFCFRYCP